MIALAAIGCLAYTIYKLGDDSSATGYAAIALFGAIGTVMFAGLYGIIVAALLGGLLIGTRREGIVQTLCLVGTALLVGMHLLPYL